MDINRQVSELGAILYKKALIRRSDEMITDPQNNEIGWLLDTRIPMLESDIFCQVGESLASRLAQHGVRQVAGFGYGSFPMVCSVLASKESGAFCGGFVRDQRKAHGRRRQVEGPLSADEPVVVLDDILNSGRSAIKSIRLLQSEGFKVTGFLSLFTFTWGGGREMLTEEGLWVDSLLDLNLRQTKNRSRAVATG